MGQLIGSFLAYVSIQLLFALPTYYILDKFVAKKNSMLNLFLSVLVGFIVGWIAAYRVKTNQLLSYFLEESSSWKDGSGADISTDKLNDIKIELMENPEIVDIIYFSATTNAFVSSLIVFLIIYLIMKRKKIADKA